MKLGSIEVVIKGGRPWGFILQGGIESGQALTVAQIEPGGKAEQHGGLKVGDRVLKINDVQCLSLTEALQLIDSAFRTLTVLIWRSSNASSDYSDTVKIAPNPGTQSIWQKAASLRQSFKCKNLGKKSKGDVTAEQRRQPVHSESFCTSNDSNKGREVLMRDWGSQRDLTRDSESHEQEVPRHVRSHSEYVSNNTNLCPQTARNRNLSGISNSSSVASVQEVLVGDGDPLILPRHQRSARKLTKDSGYETSIQGEPDYVNAEWLNETVIPVSPPPYSYSSNRRASTGILGSDRTSSISGDESRCEQGGIPSYGYRELHHLQHSYSFTKDYPKEVDPIDFYPRNLPHFGSSESLCYQRLPPPYHGSSESLISWSSGTGANLHVAKSTPSLTLAPLEDPPPPYHAVWPPSPSTVIPATSAPNLDQDSNMVTRRFKKKSVYEALASKSGLDFAPVIQRPPYWEKREVFEEDPSLRRFAKNIFQDRKGDSNLENRQIHPQKQTNNKPTRYVSEVAFKFNSSKEVDRQKDCNSIALPHRGVLSPNREKRRLPSPSVSPASSPPPPPPPRDPANVGCIKSNSSHEKYPSWPTSEAQNTSNSHRSHSWTEHTDYPKERAPYSRPKKTFQISPHQLHPVQEKFFEGGNGGSRRNSKSDGEYIPTSLGSSYKKDGDTDLSVPVALDSFYNSGMHSAKSRCYGDKDYNIHSPPERDVPVHHERKVKNYDSDPFISNYDEMLRYYSQTAFLGHWNKSSSVSLESTTPLLDRLRLESDSMNRPWPPKGGSDLETPSEAGTCAESVDSNSSSQETLKWHGSCSDLSTLSVQASNTSSLFDSGHSTLADSGRLSPQSCCSGSTLTVSPEGSTRSQVISRHNFQSESVAHSSRVEPPQRHDSESVLYYTSGSKHKRKVHSGKLSLPNGHRQQSLCERPLKVTTEESRHGQVFSTSFPGFSRNSYEQPLHSPETMVPPVPPKRSPRNTLEHMYNGANISKLKISGDEFSNMSNDSRHQLTENRLRTSVDQKDQCSSLPPMDTHKSPGSEEFAQRILYFDPAKRHRVSDPDLKAIQKQAVMSFYQRCTGLDPTERQIETNKNHQELSSSTSVSRSSSSGSNWSQASRPSLTTTRFTKPSESDGNQNSSSQSNYQHPGRNDSPASFESREPSVNEEIVAVKETSPRNETARQQSKVEPILCHEDEKSQPGDSTTTASFWSHKSGRKAQLQKVYDSETAVVKVVSSDGVTLVETVEKNNQRSSKKPQVPPKRIGKLPPHSSRPSTGSSSTLDGDEDDEELKRIASSTSTQTASHQSVPQLLVTGPSTSSSTCSSPDLPLPPPPSTTDTEVLQSDDPLPPPPDLHDVEASGKTSRQSSQFSSRESHTSCNTEQNIPEEVLCNYSQLSSSPPCKEVASFPDGHLSELSNKPVINSQISSDDVIYENLQCANSHQPSVFSNSSSLVDQHISSVPSQDAANFQRQSSNGANTSTSISEKGRERNAELLATSNEPIHENIYANLDFRNHSAHNNFLAASPKENGFIVNGCINGELIPTISVVTTATQTSDTPRLSRKQIKSKEELECERLSRDFINHYGDSILSSLLLPAPNSKTMSDYMQGLLDLGLEKGKISINRTIITKPHTKSNNSLQVNLISGRREENSLPPTSAYFTTSEPKAKLLNRYCQHLERQDWTNEAELNKKKQELIASIGKKLEILRSEQISIREEMLQNEHLGLEVTSKVEKLAKPNELAKYRQHIEELEKIINLLLLLSGRLARAQNAFLNLPEDANEEEKNSLEEKRNKLSEQHEEARHLKENIDRRSHQVSFFLQQYLMEDEYADYEHFIKMKSKLLMDAREIDEKITLGEEQLAALYNSLEPQLWSSPQMEITSHSQTKLDRT